MLVIVAVFVVLISSAPSAFACSCMVSGTVDKEFAEAANVVVLKVLSTNKRGESAKGYGYGGIKSTTLSVEKVFKGDFKIGEKLALAQGSGADCVWAFGEKSVGESYVFYLGGKPHDSKQFEGAIAQTILGDTSVEKGVWVASTCSRSGNIKDRTLDLKYLENIRSAQGKTRLSGNISQRIESAVENGPSKYKKLPNRNVRIRGNGKDVTVQTDENGDYEIYDLRPGKYRLSIESLDGYKTSPFDWDNIETVDVDIKPNHHAEQDFEYYIHNSISGVFLDSNESPLKDVCLDLYPAEGMKARSFHNFDCTNADGTFTFTQIPEGKYIIVVNDKNEISARQPFGTFYYPGKLKKEEAQVITIAAGEHLKDLVITAPVTAEVVTVTGALLYEDGKPVSKESVEFYSNDSLIRQKDKEYKAEDSRALTDEDGRFTIRILKGQKGRLLGSMTTYLEEYENCPRLDKLILSKIKDPNGITVTDIKTPFIEIDANADQSGIELRLPFPACEKSK